MLYNFFSPQLISAGIGLRCAHYAEFLKKRQPVAWLEVHAENYLNFNTPAFKALERIRQDYPISLHAVNFSLGSGDGIDGEHVKRVQALVNRLEPFLISDHLSWGRIEGYYLNDLLPLPYTSEALNLVASNLSQIQEILGCPLLVENPSSYLQYEASDMSESEFLATLAQQTGAGILLDINNVYVSCRNHSWNVETYLKEIPISKVREIHLSGHATLGATLIDDHGSQVCQDVWDLYKKTIDKFGPIPTLVEWDRNIPELDVLLSEAKQAQTILDSARIPSNSTRREQNVRFG